MNWRMDPEKSSVLPPAMRPGVPATMTPIARPIEIIIIVVGLMMCFGLWVTFQQNAEVQQFQRDGQVRTYASRAVSCDLQKAQGIPESKGCAVKEVEEFRNPDIQVGSTTSAKETHRTRMLLCNVVQQLAKRQGSTLVLPPDLCPA